MTIFYVLCENDADPSESAMLQVTAYDVPEASLKATAQVRRERHWSSVSSRSVSTTKPKIERHLPDREQRQPQSRMAARGSAVSDRGDATLVQEGLGL